MSTNLYITLYIIHMYYLKYTVKLTRTVGYNNNNGTAFSDKVEQAFLNH